MFIPFEVKFAFGSYALFSLISAAIYTLIFENWAKNDCLLVETDYLQRIIEYSATEFVILPTLFLVGIFINESSEYSIWNLIARGASYGMLLINLIFQLLWLLLLISKFQTDIIPRCSLESAIYGYSMGAIGLHSLIVIISLAVIIAFLARYLKDLYNRRERDHIARTNQLYV